MTSPVVRLATAGEVADAPRLISAQRLRFEEGCDDLVGIYDGPRLVATAARGGTPTRSWRAGTTTIGARA